MRWQSYFTSQYLRRDSSKYNEHIEVVESFGSRRLLVNGIEQTGRYTESLFRQGLKTLGNWHKGKMNEIAVIGVGGGGVFFRLRSLYQNAHLTGVDIDSKIIQIAKEYFDLDRLKNSVFQVSDAQEFAQQKKNANKFDCVIVDIYTGNDVPEFVTQARFVHSIGKIVRRGGTVMINYFSFHNQKELSGKFQKLLSTVFAEVTGQVNHKNIFIYCRKH